MTHLTISQASLLNLGRLALTPAIATTTGVTALWVLVKFQVLILGLILILFSGSESESLCPHTFPSFSMTIDH